jgi:hypothetical protein
MGSLAPHEDGPTLGAGRTAAAQIRGHRIADVGR